MVAFEFVGKGIALEAVVVVLALDEAQATVQAREWAAENVVRPDSLVLRKSTPVVLPQVVHGWNGDY